MMRTRKQKMTRMMKEEDEEEGNNLEIPNFLPIKKVKVTIFFKREL